MSSTLLSSIMMVPLKQMWEGPGRWHSRSWFVPLPQATNKLLPLASEGNCSDTPTQALWQVGVPCRQCHWAVHQEGLLQGRTQVGSAAAGRHASPLINASAAACCASMLHGLHSS